MSDTTPQSPQSDLNPESVDTSEPRVESAPPESPIDPATASSPEGAPGDESTVGTGTSMALGCIAGTIVLIVIGLLFLGISTLF